MSYARFGPDSDVYIYDGGALVCSSCSLQTARPYTVTFPTADEMIAHLHAHIDAGDKVPDGTIEEILADFTHPGDAS